MPPYLSRFMRLLKSCMSQKTDGEKLMSRRISLDYDPYCPGNYSVINQHFKREHREIQKSMSAILDKIELIFAADNAVNFTVTKEHYINALLYTQNHLSKSLLIHKKRCGDLCN